MFPITYKRRFIYIVQGDPRLAADKLRDHLARGLAKGGARNVVARNTIIRFDGNPWAFFRWHLFHAISKGKVTVDYRDDQVGIVYQISFVDYFIMFLVIIGGWTLGLLFVMRLPLSMMLVPTVFAFFWFGLFYSGSAVLNYYLFNRLIKKRLHEFFSSATNSDLHGELIITR